MIKLIHPPNNGNGRLGNQFFRAMAAHFIAEDNSNICVEYVHLFEELGIHLNTGAPRPTQFNGMINLRESYFEKSQSHTELEKKLIQMNNTYCQSDYISRRILSYLKVHSTEIQRANPFADRYNANMDVFVHVRLGDIERFNPGVSYYRTLLRSIKFNRGYIASDSLNHPICTELINEFGLEPFDRPEVETWQFGSTCRYIILSNGTFSWMIAALAFFSKVWYPKLLVGWHGNIFHSDIWQEVDPKCDQGAVAAE